MGGGQTVVSWPAGVGHCKVGAPHLEEQVGVGELPPTCRPRSAPTLAATHAPPSDQMSKTQQSSLMLHQGLLDLQVVVQPVTVLLLGQVDQSQPTGVEV